LCTVLVNDVAVGLQPAAHVTPLNKPPAATAFRPVHATLKQPQEPPVVFTQLLMLIDMQVCMGACVQVVSHVCWCLNAFSTVKQVKMVTGDQHAIAVETSRRLGLGTEIMEGSELMGGNATNESLIAKVGLVLVSCCLQGRRAEIRFAAAWSLGWAAVQGALPAWPAAMIGKQARILLEIDP
jgi:hypothetical protein